MKIKFEDIQTLVENWADKKGILEHGTPAKQLLKTLEEITELHTAIEDDDIEEIIDAIGDVVVTLVVSKYLPIIKVTFLFSCLFSTLPNIQHYIRSPSFLPLNPAIHQFKHIKINSKTS